MDSGCGEVSSAGLYPSTSSDLNEKSLKKTIPKFIYFVNIGLSFYNSMSILDKNNCS
jgi:hypothetical protein